MAFAAKCDQVFDVPLQRFIKLFIVNSLYADDVMSEKQEMAPVPSEMLGMFCEIICWRTTITMAAPFTPVERSVHACATSALRRT